MKYVLDTNIFNRVLDGKYSLSTLPADSTFVATKIQFEELNKTSNPARRSDLIQTFNAIDPELLLPSFALDVAGAGFDEGKWSNDDIAIKLRVDLEAIRSQLNNWHDALIAEVAFLNKYGLITADKNLAAVARRHGIVVCSVP